MEEDNSTSFTAEGSSGGYGSGQPGQEGSSAGGKRVNQRSFLWRWLTNKYVITLTIFFTLLIFFDTNNLISRFKVRAELRQMEIQKEYYQQEISANEQISDRLKHDLGEVEAYGREHYLMKRANEDIFLIIDADAAQEEED